jgi:hypothetical protein
MLARRLHTREWWDAERKHFNLWASAFGEAELRAGKYPRQAECVKMVRRLRYLTPTAKMKELREELLERGLVPKAKEGRGTSGDFDFPRDRLSLNLELCSHGKCQRAAATRFAVRGNAVGRAVDGVA